MANTEIRIVLDERDYDLLVNGDVVVLETARGRVSIALADIGFDRMIDSVRRVLARRAEEEAAQEAEAPARLDRVSVVDRLKRMAGPVGDPYEHGP